MSDDEARPTRSRRRLAAGLVGGALVVGGVTTAVRWDPNATSAQLGREGVRQLDRAPDELPGDVVPADAREVEGTALRDGARWMAAVSYVSDEDSDAAVARLDAVLSEAGYRLTRRAFDDDTVSLQYDATEGQGLRVTVRRLDSGVGIAVVREGADADGDAS